MAFSYLHRKTFNGLGEGKKLLTSVSHALLHFAPLSPVSPRTSLYLTSS